MFQLIVNLFILISYIIIDSSKSAFCDLEKKHFRELNCNRKKEYYSYSFKQKNLNFLSEVSHGIFKKNNGLKYQIYFRVRYGLNDENFLFLENSIFKVRFDNDCFKDVASVGFGYNIFDGPVYLSEIKFSPTIYHIKNIYHKHYSKILINSSWMYSHELIHDIHHAQYITTFANFRHIFTKLEHALIFSIKKNTIFIKCSYNIVLNENKFHEKLPNINKYIFISFMYSI